MLQLALRNLWGRPLRSSLTVGGIAVAVAVLMSLSAFGEGYRRALGAELGRMGMQMMLVPLGCPYDAAVRVIKGKTLETSLPESATTYAQRDPAVAIANGAGNDIPLMIGSNKDEAGYFVTNTPNFQGLTEEELHSRLEGILGSETDNLIATYRKQRPEASPADLLMAIGSGVEHRRVRIAAANKASKSAAPVFAYLFAWETPIAGGVIDPATVAGKYKRPISL